ncbi:hypothetical protein DUI87_17107 [Hirundo rustica rustica]|uniref:Uncharacterized protein n=1 Tax=Hirundo rustica rustica TaxID=333673 RepID=A0A3M0K566_HIRRU|nr:hypothetical protein DUI87_17107 [Hirundo rustica rustica]
MAPGRKLLLPVSRCADRDEEVDSELCGFKETFEPVPPGRNPAQPVLRGSGLGDKMSERRRSAVALSSRAHAFSVEALIGTNKKRKLRDWEDKGLDLSMESLSPNGQLGDNEDPTQCLDLNPG